MANIKIALPTEVAAKYDLVNWTGSHRQVFGAFGTIDLTELTLEKADRLYKRKFPKLRLKGESKAKV